MQYSVTLKQSLMVRILGKIAFLLLFLILGNVLFAQKIELHGFTAKGKNGIKKSLAEILAYDSTHRLPPNYKAFLRPELHGPAPRGQNPGSKLVSKSGALVAASDLNTATSLLPPIQTIHSNFLSTWGSYSVITGRESPYTPPDNIGDVGTTQIIVAGNTRLKVFSKPAVTAAASLLQPAAQQQLCRMY